MTLYQTSMWSTEIREVKYERTTAQYAIKANGSRDALVTSYNRLFTTREEAVESKITQLRWDVEIAATKLDRAKRGLALFLIQENKSS